MMAGPLFLTSLIYLTLLVSFVYSLLETGYGERLLHQTLRRWGKFLLFLVALGLIITLLGLLAD